MIQESVRSGPSNSRARTSSSAQPESLNRTRSNGSHHGSQDHPSFQVPIQLGYLNGPFERLSQGFGHRSAIPSPLFNEGARIAPGPPGHGEPMNQSNGNPYIHGPLPGAQVSMPAVPVYAHLDQRMQRIEQLVGRMELRFHDHVDHQLDIVLKKVEDGFEQLREDIKRRCDLLDDKIEMTGAFNETAAAYSKLESMDRTIEARFKGIEFWHKEAENAAKSTDLRFQALLSEFRRFMVHAGAEDGGSNSRRQSNGELVKPTPLVDSHERSKSRGHNHGNSTGTVEGKQSCKRSTTTSGVDDKMDGKRSGLEEGETKSDKLGDHTDPVAPSEGNKSNVSFGPAITRPPKKIGRTGLVFGAAPPPQPDFSSHGSEENVSNKKASPSKDDGTKGGQKPVKEERKESFALNGVNGTAQDISSLIGPGYGNNGSALTDGVPAPTGEAPAQAANLAQDQAKSVLKPSSPYPHTPKLTADAWERVRPWLNGNNLDDFETTPTSVGVVPMIVEGPHGLLFEVPGFDTAPEDYQVRQTPFGS